MIRLVTFVICLFSGILLLQVHIKRIEAYRCMHAARIALKDKDYDAVLKFGIKGVEANPYNILVNAYVGIALIAKKQPALALGSLDKCLKYYPNLLSVLVNAVYANVRAGNKKRAIVLLERIERIKPSYVTRSRHVVGDR